MPGPCPCQTIFSARSIPLRISFRETGSEMRGGTASCSIKVSDTEIYSPFIKEMDTLVAMNEASVDTFEDFVKPGGVMILNSTIIKPKTNINLNHLDRGMYIIQHSYQGGLSNNKIILN